MVNVWHCLFGLEMIFFSTSTGVFCNFLTGSHSWSSLNSRLCVWLHISFQEVHSFAMVMYVCCYGHTALFVTGSAGVCRRKQFTLHGDFCKDSYECKWHIFGNRWVRNNTIHCCCLPVFPNNTIHCCCLPVFPKKISLSTFHFLRIIKLEVVVKSLHKVLFFVTSFPKIVLWKVDF